MTIRKHLPALLALAAALSSPLSAWAQSPVAPFHYGGGDGAQTRAWQDSVKSTLTRQQVRDELLQARREGRIVHGEGAMERALLGDFKSTLTRAQVHAEMLEARRLGVLQLQYDGQTTQPTPAQAESIRQAGLRAIGADSLRAQR